MSYREYQDSGAEWNTFILVLLLACYKALRIVWKCTWIWIRWEKGDSKCTSACCHLQTNKSEHEGEEKEEEQSAPPSPEMLPE
jgi:hypothetical protein